MDHSESSQNIFWPLLFNNIKCTVVYMPVGRQEQV